MPNPDLRQTLAQLVAQYEQNRARLNEQTTRLQYILPLFRALGWDDSDPRQVSAEENIHGRYADFGFYLNGVPAFYLETKRIGRLQPSDDPKSEYQKDVRQAINYAYMRGVPWAVLSDFEHLRVFNAFVNTSRPVLKISYQDYISEEGLEDLQHLSREAFQERILESKARRLGILPKRRPVQEVLFERLMDWRKTLYIALERSNRKPAPSPALLEEAVLRLLNRLIFLRTVEDRSIEEPRLRSLLNTYSLDTSPKKPLFQRLREDFIQLDEIYNSNLFARHALDDFQVEINATLLDIFKNLYDAPDHATYDFSAISADVLGRIYENYLAALQAPPRSARARSSRHEQGIYYTPEFITHYIIQHTVQRLLAEGHDPLDLRILDPACGSGSFLIKAFDALFNAKLAQNPEADESTKQAWRIHILQDCLYGVDLDPQAIEMARLNLALRAAHRREKLPTFEHLISANSLDNSLDWARTFPEVMGAGGWHVVLGNPPYVRHESLSAEFKAYAAQTYQTHAGGADLYVYFIERSLSLLRQGGYYSVIVANKWMRAGYGKALRGWLAGQGLEEVIDFGDTPVFRDATTYPCILRVHRTPTPPATVTVASLRELPKADLESAVAPLRQSLPKSALGRGSWSLAGDADQRKLAHLRNAGQPLGDYLNGAIYRGVLTGYNEAFVIDSATRKALIQRDPRSEELIKPFLAGREVKRYAPLKPKNYLIFARRGVNIEAYPAILEHLSQYRERLMPKPPGHVGAWGGRSSGSYEWYELQTPIKYQLEFEKTKIICAEIATKGQFTLDSEQNYLDTTAYLFGSDDLYLLGVLNSSFCDFFMSQISSQIRGGALRWKRQYMEQIPIPSASAEVRGQIAGWVERRLALEAERTALDEAGGLTGGEAERFERDIRRLEAQIEEAVAGAYGL